MKILTINEVSKILSLNKYTVYEKARSGEIPGIRIGRTWRFSLKALEEWLDGKINIKFQKSDSKTKHNKSKKNPLYSIINIINGPKDLSSKVDSYLYGDSK